MIHARRHFYRMSCSCPRPPVAAWTQPLCAAVPSGAKNTVCMDGAALQRLIAGLTAFPPRYQSCALPKPHRSRSQGRGGARTAGRGFGGLPNHRGHMRRPGQRRAMSTRTTPPTHKHAPLRAAKITAIRRHLVRLCSFSSLHASVGLFNPLSFLLAQPSLHPCTPRVSVATRDCCGSKHSFYFLSLLPNHRGDIALLTARDFSSTCEYTNESG